MVSSPTPELLAIQQQFNDTLAQWYPAFDFSELGSVVSAFADPSVFPPLPSLASRTQFFNSEQALYDYVKDKGYNRDPNKKQVRHRLSGDVLVGKVECSPTSCRCLPACQLPRVQIFYAIEFNSGPPNWDYAIRTCRGCGRVDVWAYGLV